MRKVRYFAQGLWVDKHFGQWITSIVIMTHFALGVAIIIGGVDRFSPPSYNPLIKFSGGHTWLWGVGIAISAILTATPFRWPSIVGWWLAMVWHIIWMSSFTTAVLRYENAAATPVPMYGGMAMICAALLTARVIDKSGG